MELSVLNSNFQRQSLIENWSSLVWTERYSSNGDFELVSEDLVGTISALPIGEIPTVVSIRESNVPMIVESHKLVQPKNGPIQVVTTGRSFETILDRRIAINAIESQTPREPWTVEADSPSDAAWFVMKSIVTDGVSSLADIIPEVIILDNVPGVWPGGSAKYVVEPKELYAWVIETLKLGDFGLKATLPSLSGNQIGIIVYEGADRTNEVVFDASMDAFDQTTHLLSILGWKNVQITSTKNGMDYATTGVEPQGMARRVSYQDLSSEITLNAGEELTTLTKNKSLVTLADLKQTLLFSGEIARQQALGYGKDYFLGDKVKLSGMFGLSQDVRVAEFIRTHDATGEHAYPAFEALV